MMWIRFPRRTPRWVQMEMDQVYCLLVTRKMLPRSSKRVRDNFRVKLCSELHVFVSLCFFQAAFWSAYIVFLGLCYPGAFKRRKSEKMYLFFAFISSWLVQAAVRLIKKLKRHRRRKAKLKKVLLFHDNINSGYRTGRAARVASLMLVRVNGI